MGVRKNERISTFSVSSINIPIKKRIDSIAESDRSVPICARNQKMLIEWFFVKQCGIQNLRNSVETGVQSMTCELMHLPECMRAILQIDNMAAAESRFNSHRFAEIASTS